MTLEACVGNLQEALIAEKKGAHQIELCDRLDLDGTSPSINSVKKICEQLNIPIKVIVNPNPFNYTYSSSDIKQIIKYIKQLNKLPIQGFVFGPLAENGEPDLHTLKIISEYTDLPITYHKAIDTTHNILRSVQSLVDQNIIKYILSSGGKMTAVDGSDILLQMHARLKDTNIQLIAAGRVTSNNIHDLHDKLGFSHYHGKKIVGDLK